MDKKYYIIFMGVSGAGKTTVAQDVASLMHAPLIEGDVYHPESNKAKMRAAIPLTDDDRFPWLDVVGQHMSKIQAPCVIGACSVLKRIYRERLKAALGGNVLFVYLSVERAILEKRVRTRVHEFMSPDLLDSQLRTLEVPAADESAVTINVTNDEHETAAVALQKINLWLDQQGRNI